MYYAFVCHVSPMSFCGRIESLSPFCQWFSCVFHLCHAGKSLLYLNLIILVPIITYVPVYSAVLTPHTFIGIVPIIICYLYLAIMSMSVWCLTCIIPIPNFKRIVPKYVLPVSSLCHFYYSLPVPVSSGFKRCHVIHQISYKTTTFSGPTPAYQAGHVHGRITVLDSVLKCPG